MSVRIDPPEKRSLTHNERKILELLQAGNTPPEIAQKLHMPLKTSFYGTGEAMPDTVMDLICGIREKGWEIPGENFLDNEEEKIMPTGKKTPPEKVEQIKALRAEGKSYAQIASESGTSYGTVARTIQKEKPAAAATDAGSDGKSTPKNSDTKIISENSGDVKSPDKKFSEVTLNIMRDEIKHRILRIGDLRKSIQQEKDELQPLMDDFEKMGGKM